MNRLAGLGIAGLIVVAANVFVWAGVARNRSATVQRIELTERELTLERLGEENSGIDLRLSFIAGPAGLNIQKQLGDSASHPVFVALEYAGPASERARKAYINANPEYWRRVEATESRLVPVDAARDPETLRSRYGPKYLIVRARGWSLVPATVHVPLPLARKLSALARQPTAAYFSQTPVDQLKPRYRVTVAFGTRYEPWVTAVELNQ